MTPRRRRTMIVVALACAALVAWHTLPVRASADPHQDRTSATSRTTLSHALPRLDGDHLKVSIEEVTYSPGGSSPAHSHACPVVGYVVEGALRMQVKDEPEAIYRVGERFYEAPNGVHLVSANNSEKEPAKFIAVFVCDHNASVSVGARAREAS